MRTIGAISLPGRRPAPRQARTFVRTVLATAQPALDGETVGDIELCVDELVANAWEHTDSGRGGHILVKVAVDGRTLRATVIDEGGARTKPHVSADLTAEHGRGLRLVDGLAARWGVDAVGRGTAVWAEFGHAGRLGAAGHVPGCHILAGHLPAGRGPDGEVSARPDPGLPSRGGAALF